MQGAQLATAKRNHVATIHHEARAGKIVVRLIEVRSQPGR